MLTRRRFAATVASGLLAAPLAGRAQVGARTYRIGVLSTLPPGTSGVARLWEPFVQGLRELGYVEEQNLVIERRYAAEGQPDQLPGLAADLVRLKVDVIVAGGSLTPFAAKAATTTLPVVITNHGDPVGSGLVASLARPGGNITGLSLLSPELIGKQLELLKKAIPRIVRIATLWNPTSQTHPRMLSEAEAPARALGIRLERLPARGLDDYERAFIAMTRQRTDALLVLGDPIFWYQRSRIVELATKHRVPGMFGQREFVEDGGLMSYGANLLDNFRRAATYVDKILKGAKPGDLPIEQPTKFELVINSKTAKALGLTLPQSVLVQADQIIE
jgi:putative ABC transport system substrate-binding protein